MNKTIRVLFAVVVLAVGMFVLVMGDNIDYSTVNPFERVISLVKDFSNVGYTVKDTSISFVKSFTIWTDPSSSIVNTPEWLQGFLGGVDFNGNWFGLFESIYYSFSAIWNFLKVVFETISAVLRVLLG